MPDCDVNASTSSPVTKFAEIPRRALDNVALSTSVTVIPPSAKTAPVPPVYDKGAPVIVTAGGLFVAVTAMRRLAVFEFAVPSSATTEMVLALLDGSELPLL